MNQGEDRLAWVIIPPGLSQARRASLLESAENICGRLMLGMEIIVVLDDRLVHYGHADQLVSNVCKEQFINYITDQCKKKCAEIKKEIREKFPRSNLLVRCLGKEDFPGFVEDNYQNINSIILPLLFKKGLFKRGIAIPWNELWHGKDLNIFLVSDISSQ